MNVYHHRRPLGRLLLLDITRSDSRAPPSNEAGGSTENNGGHKREIFDTNMVIILVVLLCAMLFALSLHLIVRCALRYRSRRGFASESPEQTAGSLNGTAPEEKKKLCQIPISAYGSGIHIRSTDCPICLGEFLDGEEVKVLPKCHHGFHVKCIDIWLASHCSCPICRQSLLLEQSHEHDPADYNEANAQTVSII